MKKTILIIEDNTDVRENTAEILELAGFNTLTASNGKTGVEMVQQFKPDLIICDIMMPVLDGYGVLHLLGKNEETASIPFIFLTAKAERNDMRKGMEMGADDYISKPFDDIELLKAVESRLKKAELFRHDLTGTRESVNTALANIQGIEQIGNISDKQRIQTFRKKDLIYAEGDTPVGLFLLTKGKVKLFKRHELGKDLITRLLQPGDFFGYLALLQDDFQGESAEALESCEVTVFPKEDFLQLLHHSPGVARQFVRLLSGNIVEEQEKLLALAYSSVRKRTAEALLILKQRYQAESDQSFTMAIAREDLANMVGTATESLIRTLSDFKEEGLVEINGSNITITNPERLERMRN